VTPTLGVPSEVAIWEIRNEAEMDHPFHLHGMFFQVLDVEGVPAAHLGWKDTVNVPQMQTLRFVVRYGEDGRWMYHCHILEHAELGMMGELILMATP
jgi:FtsP/CotA-like multicopper oxidase with cupredoxin domain